MTAEPTNPVNPRYGNSTVRNGERPDPTFLWIESLPVAPPPRPAGRPPSWTKIKKREREKRVHSGPNPRHLTPKNQTHGGDGAMLIRKTARVSDFLGGVMVLFTLFIFQISRNVRLVPGSPWHREDARPAPLKKKGRQPPEVPEPRATSTRALEETPKL